VLGPNAKLHAEIISDGQKNKSKPSDANDNVLQSTTPVRISRMHLLKPVFDIDIEHCPYCSETMKTTAAILKFRVITKILDHLGLPTQALLRSPASGFELIEPIMIQTRARLSHISS